MLSQPTDQMRLVLIFFLQYPLGWVQFYMVPNGTRKHLWNIIVGFIIQYYLFRSGVLHVILMTGVTWALMNFLPRNVQQRYVMTWVLSYLTCNHLYRMYTNFGGYDLEISTFTMLQVCKLSAMSFCYKDGGEPEASLSKDQKDRMIKEMPSVLELCSYTWYVSNCALGVFFEFSDYIRFIHGKKEYANCPSPILPSLKSLATALACVGLFIYVSGYFSIEYIYDSDFANHTFLYKVFYYYTAMTIKRFFYYGPFMFTTGAI